MFLPCPGRGVGVVRTEVRKWMRCSQTLCLCLSGSHGDERHLCGQFGEDGGTENWTSSCRRLGGRMYNQGSRGSAGLQWLFVAGYPWSWRYSGAKGRAGDGQIGNWHQSGETFDFCTLSM